MPTYLDSYASLLIQAIDFRHSISFMRLRSTLEEGIHLRLKGYQHFPLQEHISRDDLTYRSAAHFASFQQFRGRENAFNTWLQWMFPALSITWKGPVSKTPSAVLTDHATQTVVSIEPQEDGLEIVAQGERHLWSEIFYTYQDWLECGKPGLEAYTFCIDQQGQPIMKMDYEGISRIFPFTTQ